MIGVTTRRGGRAVFERLAICSSAIFVQVDTTRKRNSRACRRISRRRLRRRRRKLSGPARRHTIEEADTDANPVGNADGIAVALSDVIAASFAESEPLADRNADVDTERVAVADGHADLDA